MIFDPSKETRPEVLAAEEEYFGGKPCFENGRNRHIFQSGFNAGAASLDAEVAGLRAQINNLLEGMGQLMRWQVKNVDKWHNSAYDNAQDIIDTTPEQSLAEYRNKVIEECACIFGGPNTPVSNEEAEAWRNPPAAIRALKEQP